MQSPPPTHKEPLAVSSFDLPRQVQPNFQIEFICPRAANSTAEPSWLCAPIFFSAYSVSLRLIFLSFFRMPRQRPESSRRLLALKPNVAASLRHNCSAYQQFAGIAVIT